MEESNWIPTIVVAIIAASPGILALFRQMRKDSHEAEEKERQANVRSRLELDRAAWERAGETMQRQEQKITKLEESSIELKARLVKSDARIKKLERDIDKYELLMEERDRTITDLERKLKAALKESSTLRKKLGEQ